MISNTGRTVEHWHTRTETGNLPRLSGMVANAWLEMNAVDAERLQMGPHDRVTIDSRRNPVSGVELRVMGSIALGRGFSQFNLRRRTRIS